MERAGEEGKDETLSNKYVEWGSQNVIDPIILCIHEILVK